MATQQLLHFAMCACLAQFFPCRTAMSISQQRGLQHLLAEQAPASMQLSHLYVCGGVLAAAPAPQQQLCAVCNRGCLPLL